MVIEPSLFPHFADVAAAVTIVGAPVFVSDTPVVFRQPLASFIVTV